MEKELLTVKGLTTNLPVKIVSIQELYISEAVSCHGEARLVFTITAAEKELLIDKIHPHNRFTITHEDVGPLFAGLPVYVKTSHSKGIYTAEVILKSISFLMDQKLISRSFQDKSNPYSNIFTDILGNYGGSCADLASKGKTQGKSIIQYKETDWNFILRMASQLETCVIVDSLSGLQRIMVGLSTGSKYDHPQGGYIVRKETGYYLVSEPVTSGWKELESLSFTVEGIDAYDLGDKVSYNEINFVVGEKHTFLRHGILVFRYKLQREQALKLNLILNQEISGVSIDGTVLSVKKDTARLHLCIDESQDEGTAYDYQLNTGYTTEGATGVYVMPQPGDSVKLYFPTAYEENGYIKTITRTDGETNGGTQDPRIKYFENNYGKEMKLAPSEFKFTASDGKVEIAMSDDGGINIIGSSAISVHSEKHIQISGNKVTMKPKEELLFVTEGSTIKIHDIVELWGDGGVSL